MTDAAGSESWSYDAMGRVVTDQRKTNGVTKTTSYAYNPDGTLKTLAYPSGRVVNYQVGGAELALSATDSGSGINYVSGAAYAPQGALAAAALAGGNINLTQSYSSRLQPSTIHAVSASGTDLLDLAYDFGLGTADNGDVKAIVNNRDSTRTQYFAYDALNRIVLANTQASSGANAWGQAFGYDPWGNLTNVNVTQGSAPALSVSVNGNNRISSSGYSYDAAGDALTDSVNTYTWNAEGKMATVTSSLYGLETYVYDGQDRRVMKKTAGKLYWYGTDGNVVAESDLAGNITDEYIFFGGERVARVDSQGKVDYYLADHLGSSRVVTDANGNILDDCDFMSFGDEQCVASSSGNTYQFTGKERDSESGNDYFSARYYSSGIGRFMSPDPAGKGAVNLSNPQSWNAYSYAVNNPTTLTDPTGLCAQTNDGGWAAVGSGGGSGGGCVAPTKTQQQQQITSNYKPDGGNETVADIAGRVNHETMGMKDSKTENESLAKAQNKIAHVRLNGIKKWGNNVQRHASLASPVMRGAGYKPAIQVVKGAILEDLRGIDPTNGALFYNMRTAGQFQHGGDFQGQSVHTYSGPFISPSEYQYIMTYGP